MAHVICRYTDDECDELFLEGTYKRVTWDGLSLHAGNHHIMSHEYFIDQIERTGEGYMGGATDIQYLEIDNKVYVDQH